MSQNGGEKELVLGNKQLISLFFVVVALCGVFFAMGYMVRGNSLKGTISTTGDAPVTTADNTIKRQQPEPPRETSVDPPATTTPPGDLAPQTAEPARTETQPAQDSAPASGASVDPKPSAMKYSEPVPDTKSAPRLQTPEPGATYVQVGALPLSDAQTTVRALREQHLPASIAPSSKENLYRVLVGPYHLTTEVADAKQKLKALGFSNTIVQKQQ